MPRELTSTDSASKAGIPGSLPTTSTSVSTGIRPWPSALRSCACDMLPPTSAPESAARGLPPGLRARRCFGQVLAIGVRATSRHGPTPPAGSPMALTVVVRSGDHPTPLKISLDAPRIVIGRGDGCEIRLPDPSVSHRHASLRQRGSDYVVVDEGSTNGTFVGPVRLSPQAPRVVRSGELVRIGRIWLELTVEPVPATDDAQLATREIALSLVSSALAAQGEAAAVKVIVEAGPDAGKELALAE